MTRTTIFRLATLLVVALCNACMYSPANESQIATKDTAISISGIGPVNESVIIRAAATPTGPWFDVAELNTDASGAYNGSEVVPVTAWMPLCTAGGGYETFIRADLQAGGSLATFDDAPIGSTGMDCVAGYLADDNLAGVTNCVSEDSPVARVVALAGGTGASFWNGDVVIDDPSDVDAIACVETILGSLTIDDGVVEDLSLPRLVGVTGDVTMTLERPVGVFVDTEIVHLPALASVGGTIDLWMPQPAGAGIQTIAANFGMNALTSVGGDIELQIDGFNCTPYGFAALTNLSGSVSYDSCSDDSQGHSLMTSLTTVGTDLHVILGGSTQHSFFEAVTNVGGDATIENGVWVGDMFTALTTVGGTLHVADVDIQPVPPPLAFDALALAGAIDWENANRFDAVGAAAVAIGGLRFHDSDDLTELDVLMSKYLIAPDAAITITDNANLPQCHAEDWVAGLAGHVGPVDVSGNQFCPILGPPPVFTIDPPLFPPPDPGPFPIGALPTPR